MYASDNVIRAAIENKRSSMVEEQMRIDWDMLAQTVSSYARAIYESVGNAEVVTECEELFRHQILDNIIKAQKFDMARSGQTGYK